MLVQALLFPPQTGPRLLCSADGANPEPCEVGASITTAQAAAHLATHAAMALRSIVFFALAGFLAAALATATYNAIGRWRAQRAQQQVRWQHPS